MRTIGILAALGALAMLAALMYGFVAGDFLREGSVLLSLAWGGVSLVDLYVAFVLFASWILYREGWRLRTMLWIVAVMTLGSLAICLYLMVLARSSRGDWNVFFGGRHAGARS